MTANDSLWEVWDVLPSCVSICGWQIFNLDLQSASLLLSTCSDIFWDCVEHLQSIRSYFAADDDFNWNYGLALAATGKYAEAEEALASVQRPEYR